jgi:hypothetical protein
MSDEAGQTPQIGAADSWAGVMSAAGPVDVVTRAHSFAGT